MIRFPFSRIQVPLTSVIRDRRVVAIWNILYIIACAVSVIVFVFSIKGWSAKASVTVNGNMWMSEHAASTGEGENAYCGNKDFDYTYDHDFRYANISCVNLTANEILSKGNGFPGAYFVTTMLHTQFLKKKLNCSNSPSTGSAVCKEKNAKEVGPAQAQFVSGLEHYLLSSKIFAKVEQEILFGADIYASTPSGELKLLSQASNMMISMQVWEWLNVFEIKSLDENSTEINKIFSTDASIGDARYRMTGLNMYIRVEVANIASYFSFPGKPFIILYLDVGKSWQRVTYRGEPVGLEGYSKLVDAYGLRFLWETLETQVYIFSWRNSFISTLDVLIFFEVVRVLASFAFMRLFGKDSQKWRGSIERTMEEQVYLSDTVRAAHRRSVLANSRLAAETREEELSYEHFRLTKSGSKRKTVPPVSFDGALSPESKAPPPYGPSQETTNSLHVRKSELLPVGTPSKYII
eukprot:g2184.t1